MKTTMYAAHRSQRDRPGRRFRGVARARPGRDVAVAMAVGVAVVLSSCSTPPKLADLPPDVASARPSITLEEANFVVAAQGLGASVTGESVAEDIETGTTTCWALRSGGVTLAQLAVDEQDQPLGNAGEALRAKQLMAAGIRAFCDDYADQIPQLRLP